LLRAIVIHFVKEYALIVVFLVLIRTVEDFDDWTNWLLYKGGVGVKGDNSWESWWEEEQVSSNAFVWTLWFVPCI
jgi:hypothetical protein